MSDWFANTMRSLAGNGARELTSLGVGPVTIDVQLARELGWSDETIALVAHSAYLAVRGANITTDMAVGRACEMCGRAEPHYQGCECIVAKSLRAATKEGA